MKVLVAGWFSFEEMGATAGDLFCRDLVCRWLDEAGRKSDVALASPFEGGVDWARADPAEYADVVFVCGPFGNGPPVAEFLERFAGCRLIGVSLTMLEPLEVWNPFDLLLERDSSAASRPDISFLSDEEKVPVVGVVRIDTQPEYKERDGRRAADEAIDRLIASRPMAVVPVDTRLDINATGQRSAAEIESLIARMDAVVTTRMHGMILAIKNGVPAVVIDTVAGGAKISRQAKTIGWPVIFTVDSLGDGALSEAFEYCLTDEARAAAAACRRRAIEKVREVRARFVSALKLPRG
ncbi:MAG: polysaccharide pyruvyl transferase family protein [Candidatus Eisenbacteria bacterium]